jgi:hypothetical protein
MADYQSAFEGSEIDEAVGLALNGAVVFAQNTAATVWVIPHNLGKLYVDVQLIDNVGNTCTADIEYTSINVVTVTFSVAMTGTAVIRR